MDGKSVVRNIERLVGDIAYDLDKVRKDYDDIRKAQIGLSHVVAEASELAAKHTVTIGLQAEVMADVRKRIAALELRALGEPTPPEQDDAFVTMKLSLDELKTILGWRCGAYGLEPASESSSALTERLQNAIAVLRIS